MLLLLLFLNSGSAIHMIAKVLHTATCYNFGQETRKTCVCIATYSTVTETPPPPPPPPLRSDRRYSWLDKTATTTRESWSGFEHLTFTRRDELSTSALHPEIYKITQQREMVRGVIFRAEVCLSEQKLQWKETVSSKLSKYISHGGTKLKILNNRYQSSGTIT